MALQYLFFILLIFSTNAFAANLHHTVRLAVFDNPQPDPSRSEDTQQYKESYLEGINTAITVAAIKGIYITEKEFFYENNLTSIIQQASNVKTWQPDVVMGLNSSNDFIMSKAFFGDEVILSISATDPALSSLPVGFYSLGMPDTAAVNTMIKFINQHYPKANLFITAAAESKESIDFADLLAKKYRETYKNNTAIEKKFITEDMKQLDLNNFMSAYKKNDVIVIMSIGYNSAIDLMNKISNFLKPVQPIFLTSSDNWGNSDLPQHVTGNYDSFRVDTLSGSEDTNEYKIFLKNYKTIYHRQPKDKISFVTYQTVMSFVEAIKKYPSTSISKETILKSYTKALKHNPNWYRPPYYIVYRVENQTENFYQKII